MNIEGYDIGNLGNYFDGSNSVGAYNNLPRKKKKEFKKSKIYYDKDLDLVVIFRGNKKREIGFYKFFNDMQKTRESDFSIYGLQKFILTEILKT